MGKIKNYLLPIISIIAVLFIILFLRQCSLTANAKKDTIRNSQIANQNYHALNDSIKIYKNKVNQITYNKPIAEMSINDLKQYNPDLYQKIKNEGGDIKIIYRTNVVYRDTGSVKNVIVQLDSNEYALNYNYYSKDSSLHVNSTNLFYLEQTLNHICVNPGISTINDLSLKMGFTTGIKKEGNLFKIFLTPDNDNIVVTKLEGADVSNLLIPPVTKKKRFSIGPYIGYGIVFKGNAYNIGPGVGICFGYSLIRF